MEPSRDIFQSPFTLSSNTNPPGFNSPWHWHEINEIYICETNGMHYLVGDKLYEIHRGDILLFNSMDVHRALPPENEDYSRKVILFKDDFLRSWNSSDYDLLACFQYRAEDFCHYRSLSSTEYKRIKRFYAKGAEALSSNHPASVLQQKMVLAEILIFLNEIYAVSPVRREYLKNSSDKEYIQRVLTYIEMRISEEITLPVLSREFGISVNTLNSRFKKVTGMTVHQFIIQRRLQRACTLLKQGQSVSDSAYDSGFGDLSHFIRCFKANIGTTPGNYAPEKSTGTELQEN